MNPTPGLVPLLVVRDASRAIDFYCRTLGARQLAVYVNGVTQSVSHAELALGDAVFAVTEEARNWNSDAPPSLGGSPVVMQLWVDDVDSVVAALCNAGADVIFALQEFCGERMARLRDPFGHLWIVSQVLERLSTEEKQRRRDELLAKLTKASPRTGTE
ncbi:MAG TPA: VOC family protein [Polyangiaceae bacterium]|jgi:PhnB protein|nr:VOC family protein [Polyangiaceae bacterium]